MYLSGGEQQRIAIARVMLKNSPVIILDEATAFADPDNESRVQAAFSNLSKNKTVIMIAHRLSTVADVDKIYVLADGRIVESGKRSQSHRRERPVQQDVERLSDFRKMESRKGGVGR